MSAKVTSRGWTVVAIAAAAAVGVAGLSVGETVGTDSRSALSLSSCAVAANGMIDAPTSGACVYGGDLYVARGSAVYPQFPAQTDIPRPGEYFRLNRGIATVVRVSESGAVKTVTRVASTGYID